MFAQPLLLLALLLLEFIRPVAQQVQELKHRQGRHRVPIASGKFSHRVNV